jgi:hypothetical protein
MKVPLKKFDPRTLMKSLSAKGSPRAMEYITVAAIGMKL